MLFILVVLASSAVAQGPPSCPQCVLGLWDDREMTRAFGSILPMQY
jgi:hypothetical protein